MPSKVHTLSPALTVRTPSWASHSSHISSDEAVSVLSSDARVRGAGLWESKSKEECKRKAQENGFRFLFYPSCYSCEEF